MNPTGIGPVDTASRRGILSAGNWVVDHVKLIDAWPAQDTLATILGESWGNGGGPYNVLKNLAKIGAPFPLAGIGLVGADAFGDQILDDCRRHGIDTGQLRRTGAAPTSYTDVMTERGGGHRTFFHQRGANALLAPEHFDFGQTRARIFHLGYLLLLDGLDALDQHGLPRAVGVFRRAREAGLMTSLDCVSEPGERARRIVLPVLPEVDVLFANDYEAEQLTWCGLRPDRAGAIDRAAVASAARELFAQGVRTWVVLHFPEGAFALSRDGAGYWQPSVAMPPEAIEGTAGAGDAFAAGVLNGLHEGWSMPECLRAGVCVAAASLTRATCSDGVLPLASCLDLARQYGWRSEPDAGAFVS